MDLQFTEWPDPSWAGWHALVLMSRAASSQHLRLLRDRGIPCLVVGERHVALGRALELLREQLIDEVDIELLPWAIGGRGTPALSDCTPLEAHEWPTRLRLVEHEVLADRRVRLRYAVLGR